MIKIWECMDCGYEQESARAPRKCPECGADAESFDLYEYDEDADWGDDEDEDDDEDS